MEPELCERYGVYYILIIESYISCGINGKEGKGYEILYLLRETDSGGVEVLPLLRQGPGKRDIDRRAVGSGKEKEYRHNRAKENGPGEEARSAEEEAG